MEIVYSTDPVSNAGDRQVLDPKEFEQPLPNVKIVYCDLSLLKIRFGYETLGVKVLPLSELPQPKSKTSMKGDPSDG